MTNRIDLFTLIHKGLRWWMGDVSAQLGATDFTDPAAATSLEDLIACLETLEAHSTHEATFIAPVLDARSPYRGQPWHAEHASLDAQAETLVRQARELRAAGATHPQATAIGLELYRAFARFTSEMYLHLDDEETRLMPLLWAVCTDEELTDILTAFRAAHGPESAILYARLATAFTPAERTLLGV